MPSISTFGQLMLVRGRSGYDLLNEKMPITEASMVNLWLQLWTTYSCSDRDNRKELGSRAIGAKTDPCSVQDFTGDSKNHV
jgi:hypothetical protein